MLKVWIIFFIISLVPSCLSGAHNLNMHNGVTNSDIYGDDVFFEILEPSELQYTYRIRPANDFGGQFNQSFCMKNTKLVPMDPIDGCTSPINEDLIEGNVALAMRGKCSFLHKTIVAEQAGARAVIITETDNNDHDTAIENLIQMIDDKTDREASIPAGFLLGRNGGQIQTTLWRLHMPYALINIPLNMTYVPIHKMNQPPWTSW